MDDIPPNRSLAERRKSGGLRRPKKVNIPWDEVEALYCAGHSADDIAAEYTNLEEGITLTSGSIRKRSHDKQWATPYNLRKRANELIKQANKAELGDVEDDPVKALAQRVATQQLQHQSSVLDITQKQINDAKGSERNLIRSAHDFELMDRVARRTLGLDIPDETANLAININGFANPPRPVEGHVVEEE